MSNGTPSPVPVTVTVNAGNPPTLSLSVDPINVAQNGDVLITWTLDTRHVPNSVFTGSGVFFQPGVNWPQPPPQKVDDTHYRLRNKNDKINGPGHTNGLWKYDIHVRCPGVTRPIVLDPGINNDPPPSFREDEDDDRQ